jgi:1-deoxy-D-xylulose-5-phosphate reductoisomerase
VRAAHELFADNDPVTAPRDVVILGSTGSIGTQALDIIRRNPGRFRVVGLAAGGANAELLADQVAEFRPAAVAIAHPASVPGVRAALAGSPTTHAPPTVLAGPDGVAELAAWPGDVVLNGITGAAGLPATLAALDAGRVLALANKESLIVGGSLVTSRAKPGQIVPVDSEHSTIAQCLRAGSRDEVRRLILTASGGPFRGWPRNRLESVTPQQALAHPTWSMGPLVTVNSATLVNKGLEVIEAHLLFGFGLDKIDVVVHPQSIVHSMVEFVDAATIIQASPPDMRLPIALGLAWPERVRDASPRLDWSAAASWTFEPLDADAFPAVPLARAAAAAGGTMPAVYNAANEACVADFLAGRISFTRIVDTVARIVSEHDGAHSPVTSVEEVLAIDGWARRRARELNASAARLAVFRCTLSGIREDERMDLVGVVIFLVALMFSVMLHETGHFVMAKRFGMKCTRYFIGFGPTLWSTWRGETEYGIKALPLGGFVKIIGMHSLDEVDDPEDEARTFRRQPAWQRIIVLCAGSFMHFVLAFALIIGLAMTIGIENQNTTLLGTVTTCVPADNTALNNGVCGGSTVKAPALLAGLRVGDTVIAFNGQKVDNWNQLGALIRAASVGSVASVTVLRPVPGARQPEQLTLHATLAQVRGRSGAYMGIAPQTVFQVFGPLHAVTWAGWFVGQELSGSAKAIADLPAAIPKLFTKERAQTAGGQVGSVVGAAEATGQAVAASVGWRYKVEYILLLIAALNAFIGLFNMLPLLPLDGGHVAIIVWERIRAWFARLRGRPDPGLVDMSKVLPVSFSIFMIIVFFGVLLILADIVNPVSQLGQ